MGKEEIPGILKPNRRKKENAWQKFWRKYRMRSVRNTSDHALYFAFGLLLLMAALAILLYVGLKGAQFQGIGGGTPSPLEGR